MRAATQLLKVAQALLALVAVAGGSARAASEFDCITEPSRTVEIRASVEGLLSQVLVDRGQTVKAGQVVATLDSGLDQANADLARYKSQMQGAIKSGESRLQYAGVKARRNEELHAEKLVSAQDRDEAVTERRLAEAQLQETRDNQRVAELEYRRESERLRMRTLRSPITGVVVERQMNVGEFADNKDTRRPIMKIADIYALHVETLLPIEAVGKVKPGQSATVFPEAPAGSSFPAKVKVVDRVLDPASGTFGVRLDLPNANLAVPAGVKCRVRIDGVDVARPPRLGLSAPKPASTRPPAPKAGGQVPH
jgi:RND family efflux transporter MFP subunit